MIRNKLFSEIFDEFKGLKTNQERIEILKAHKHPSLEQFLFYAFNPKVMFDVEIPKYRESPEPAGLNYTYLSLEIPKLYRFIKNHPKRPRELTSEKQKQLLVVVLESLYKDESEILVKLLSKKFQVPHLTLKLIQEVYPNFLK